MNLWYSKTSPYARKAIIIIKHHRLEKQVELLCTSSAFKKNSPHNRGNPLGRIPALQMENGEWLYGSYLISEYLDSLGNQSKLIPSEQSRWHVLAAHALADGILENAMPMAAERMLRPEEERWTERPQQLQERCRNSFEILEKILKDFNDELNIATLTAVCVIDWWNLREENLGFSLKQIAPNLVTWASKMNQKYPVLTETWSN